MNTLKNLLNNLLTYTVNSYIIFSDDAELGDSIYNESKKYTDHILLLKKNSNKDSIYKAQLFFTTASVLPKIVIFTFSQTESTINASLKMIEELSSNQYIFIVSDNHDLPITLLSRCLQIHNYNFNELKYNIALQEIINLSIDLKEYNTHQLYDFLKHLCNKFIKYKYNIHSNIQLTNNESQLYSKTTNYAEIFQNINHHYNLYTKNNLSSVHINQILLNHLI